MKVFPKNINYRGQSILTAQDTTTLSVIGTYYKINGTFSADYILGFSHNTNGTLTYTKTKDCIFLFNGVSDLEVNKACEITYALFINGISVAETLHDFAATSKIENISITAFLELQKNNYLEIYAKSDTVDTIITVSSLLTTYLGQNS